MFQSGYANLDSLNTAAICIGYIFKAREIKDSSMKGKIIDHLIKHLNDEDEWTKTSSLVALKQLSLDAKNRAYILNGNLLNIIAKDLQQSVEGNEKEKEQIMNKQINGCEILNAFLE
ncbi:MAG: hypothetical protein EZS28_053595, partial [Streblomastix strix]